MDFPHHKICDMESTTYVDFRVAILVIWKVPHMSIFHVAILVIWKVLHNSIIQITQFVDIDRLKLLYGEGVRVWLCLAHVTVHYFSFQRCGS